MPLAVGATVYEAATEKGTSPKDKAHFQEERAIGGALVTGAVMMNPVTAIAGGWAVNAKTDVNKSLAREDARMSEQSVDLKHAKSMAFKYHDELLAKGALFDEHWSFDLGNDRNRQLLMETLNAKAAELEKQRDASKPWFSFGKTKERYEDLNSDLHSVNSAIGELQNHEVARHAAVGMLDVMRRNPSALGATGMRLAFNQHSGDPLPPSAPGGGGGRGRNQASAPAKKSGSSTPTLAV